MNDRMSMTGAFKALVSYGPAVWLGVVAIIITLIIKIILYTKEIPIAGGEQNLK